MKGEKTLAVLDILLGVSCDAVALFLVASSGARGVSGMEYEYQKLQFSDYHTLRDLAKDAQELHRFRNLLSRLKRQELISQTNDSKWNITKKGIKKINFLREQVVYQKKYEKAAGNQAIIFIFDIPEQKRKKRDWIRRVLKELDFYMLQRSVWRGTNKLPKEFVKDLRKLGLESYIHIFSVKEEGTLGELGK